MRSVRRGKTIPTVKLNDVDEDISNVNQLLNISNMGVSCIVQNTMSKA